MILSRFFTDLKHIVILLVAVWAFLYNSGGMFVSSLVNAHIIEFSQDGVYIPLLAAHTVPLLIMISLAGLSFIFILFQYFRGNTLEVESSVWTYVLLWALPVLVILYRLSGPSPVAELIFLVVLLYIFLWIACRVLWAMMSF